MTTTVIEIAPEVFQINYFNNYHVSQYLIRDEYPTMVGTGLNCSFEEVQQAVRKLVDPSTLRYLCIPWMAMDQCGSLNRFLALAPKAEPVTSFIGANVVIGDFSDRPARTLGDGERLELGAKTLVGVLTPWVPSWDGMMFFDETDGVLFTGDLFVNQRDPKYPITDDDADAAKEIVVGMQQSAVIPSTAFLEAALQKFEKLAIKTLAPHHGPLLTGNPAAYYRLLRENTVADMVDAPFPKGNFAFIKEASPA
ncbi:MAG: hypothetical protein ACREU6_11340 [Steroidobacteraceae bacterium]